MRHCDWCGAELAAGKRSDARYCDAGCRTAASTARRGRSAEKPQGKPFPEGAALPWSLVAFTVGVVASLAFPV